MAAALAAGCHSHVHVPPLRSRAEELADLLDDVYALSRVAASAPLRWTQEALTVQGREVDALRTYSRLARLRYEGGYTSYIEVLDAERSLFNAQLSYTQAQSAVFTSMVNLYKAMGGGWVDTAERLVGQ